MKCLIKLFFASSFFCISIVSSFANESEIKTIASAKADARKAIGEIYSCEYKITYSNLENQKAFSIPSFQLQFIALLFSYVFLLQIL